MGMHTTEKIDSYDVCLTCFELYHGIMDELHDVDYTQSIAGWGRLLQTANAHYGENVVFADASNYNEFSWQQCQCCGSKLGGSRYEFDLIAR